EDHWVGVDAAVAEQGPHRVRDGDRVVADGERDQPHRDHQPEQGQADGDTAPVHQQRPAAAAPDRAGGGGVGDRHSRGSLPRRRIIAISTGAPTKAMVTPTATSLGRTITRPTTSATSSSVAASTVE